MRIWRNWQTRMVQVHVKAISCRFKSCYPHQKKPDFIGLFAVLWHKKCWQTRKGIFTAIIYYTQKWNTLFVIYDDEYVC